MYIPLLVLLSALPFCIRAQVVLPVTTLPFENLYAVVQPHTLVYTDKGRKLNLTAVQDLLEQGRFLPDSIVELSLPGKYEFGHYQFWLVFVLENGSADTLDLIVSKIHHCDTIWRQKDGEISVALCIPKWFPAPLEPKLLPYDVRALGVLRLLPNQRDTFFAQSYRTKPDHITPYISSPQAYELQRLQDSRSENLFFFMFFGAIGAIFLFAVSQYVQHRDEAFLWYALYLAVMLFTTWRNIEADNPWLYSTYYLAPATWTKIIQMAAYFCCYSLFVYYLLEKQPKLLRMVVHFILGISLLTCIVNVILMALSLYYESWLLLYLYRVVLIALSVVFLGLLWRKSNIVTRLIFTGTLFAIVGELASMIWDGKVNTFGAGIGVGLEICFLSIAIAYRSRLFRHEHNRLLARHIAQLKENESLREIARREEVAAFKNRFYDNITHEFRTPLTIIIGMAESLRINLDNATQNTGHLIERNGRDLLRLVNQLLALSKSQTSTLPLSLVNADIMPFIKVVTESVESLAALKKQQLSVHTNPKQLFMDYDPDLLQQILTNLVGNALKFTPESGEITVTASYFMEDRSLELRVADNGVGIQEASLPYIFDRFYQVEYEMANGREGSGIGLALVKEWVALMQGSIEVSSQVGLGSVFRVNLPVKNALLPSIPTEDLQESTAAPIDDDTALPILLLVEDNSDLVQYLRLLLQDQYQLLSAADGQDGLEKVFAQMPDIVLSDVMMPGMDGLEFCQTLKNDPRSSHIPVVMLTALATVGDKIGGLQHGADAWLVKPFDRDELFATLTAMLESRKRLRRYFAQGKGVAPDADQDPVLRQQNIFLDTMRVCIDAHLEEAYEVPQLARDVGMAEASLYRKMKALGLPSPALFIRSHRLAQAQMLLRTTDLTVTEIAYRTGFSDLAYFSNCFRQEFGKSPKMWRKG